MVTKYIFISFVLLVIGIEKTKSDKTIKDLPSYFPKCNRDDPKLNACLLEATDKVRPFLQRGVPEMNIPIISPFTIPEVQLNRGTDAVNFRMKMTNVTLTGLDTYDFTRFDFDIPNRNFNAKLYVYKLQIEADYQVEGKILSVPIVGKGHISALVLNSTGAFTDKFHLRKRNDGFNYLEVFNIEVSIRTGEVKNIIITGLNDGNSPLKNIAEKVLKDNQAEIIKEVEPAVSEVISQVIDNVIIKNLFKIPFERLYPITENNMQ